LNHREHSDLVQNFLIRTSECVHKIARSASCMKSCILADGSRDVELSFTSTSDGYVSVHLDSADSQLSYGKIIIKGEAAFACS
jgi:hypothetical protein